MENSNLIDVPRYWRMRLNARPHGDFSRQAWSKNVIGVWYGAWSAGDLKNALQQQPDRVLEYLNKLPAQRRLSRNAPFWADGIKKEYLATIKRFIDISPNDWVLIYLKDTRELAMAQVRAGEIQSGLENFDAPTGEIFKFREIVPESKRTFRLADLPDPYLLLSSQGRGNVHQFKGMLAHVKLLASSGTIAELQKAIQAWGVEELLDFYSATGWESICFAYLEREYQFVPTGLSVGGTLKELDIVGRRFCDGKRIVAQCKKDREPQPIDDNFAPVIAEGDLAFYCAYGGIVGDRPSKACLISKNEILAWMTATSEGKRYKELLLSAHI